MVKRLRRTSKRKAETKPRGRPQGSHPASTLPSPLQRLRGADESHRIFVRAGMVESRVGTLAVALGVGLGVPCLAYWVGRAFPFTIYKLDAYWVALVLPIGWDTLSLILHTNLMPIGTPLRSPSLVHLNHALRNNCYRPHRRTRCTS
jgi:hypothetical protein